VLSPADATPSVFSVDPTTNQIYFYEGSSGGSGGTAIATRPSTLLNDWGAYEHVGCYEGGVSQGYFFGTSSDSTWNYANPDSAVDGDEGSYAYSSYTHTHAYAGVVWKFNYSGKLACAALQILAENANSTITQRSAGLWYSLDNGSTWTEIYNSAYWSKQWSVIPIDENQEISSIHVMAFTDAHDNMGQRIYDVKITGTAV
jgi:hypothetical protein